MFPCGWWCWTEAEAKAASHSRSRSVESPPRVEAYLVCETGPIAIGLGAIVITFPVPLLMFVTTFGFRGTGDPIFAGTGIGMETPEGEGKGGGLFGGFGTAAGIAG